MLEFLPILNVFFGLLIYSSPSLKTVKKKNECLTISIAKSCVNFWFCRTCHREGMRPTSIGPKVCLGFHLQRRNNFKQNLSLFSKFKKKNRWESVGQHLFPVLFFVACVFVSRQNSNKNKTKWLSTLRWAISPVVRTEKSVGYNVLLFLNVSWNVC